MLVVSKSICISPQMRRKSESPGAGIEETIASGLPLENPGHSQKRETWVMSQGREMMPQVRPIRQRGPGSAALGSHMSTVLLFLSSFTLVVNYGQVLLTLWN